MQIAMSTTTTHTPDLLVELQLYYSHTRESLKKNHILLHRFMVTFYDLKHVIDLTRHRMLEGRRRVKS